MNTIFLATLGQRPESITFALDKLIPRYRYASCIILHTEPRHSGIATAVHQLEPILAQDYEIDVIWHELVGRNGEPIIDVTDFRSAEGYFLGIYDVLLEYKLRGYTLHLMVAGGRKAMSIYATLAATRLFVEKDRVWTVLSPPELIAQKGMFHIPLGYQDRVYVVELPILPSRLLIDYVPTEYALQPHQTTDQKLIFLAKLTSQENALIEEFMKNPYLKNAELAQRLNKSPRTIENQLQTIYRKLEAFLDFGEHISDKRALLRDFLGRST